MAGLVREAMAVPAVGPRLVAKAGARKYDYLVVGAGFAGSVLAERLASQHDAQVLVIDKRPHIAGNAYDHLDEAGILIHQYGPHIFHTNSDERSEEHTSELQSLMRNSYAVFCLKK